MNTLLIRFRRHRGDVFEEVLKQSPDVMTGVDFFHFNLGVNEAMREKVDICFFDFGQAAIVGNDSDNIVQIQKRVTFDFRDYIFS